MDATVRNSNYFEDCQLYVVIPSGINALVSAVLVVACLVTRKVISTTAVSFLLLNVLCAIELIIRNLLCIECDKLFPMTLKAELHCQVKTIN